MFRSLLIDDVGSGFKFRYRAWAGSAATGPARLGKIRVGLRFQPGRELVASAPARVAVTSRPQPGCEN